MKVDALLSKHYPILFASALSARTLLVLPLVIFAFVYSYYLPTSQVANAVAWGAVLSVGAILYASSMTVDILVVAFKVKALNYNLVAVARIFRIITYFYVAVTISNFAYRSYVAVGFNPGLHLLATITMAMLVGLIAFHAYQCKEGLSYGGSFSEKPSW